MPPLMKIRVILADDHPMLTAGLKHILSGTSTIEVVGVARDSGEIVDQLDSVACDVLITDYSMPGGRYGDGLAFLSFIRRRYPNLKIVVFTMIDNPPLTTEIARMGVRGVVNKGGNIDLLVAAVHAVVAGDTFFPETTDSRQLEAKVARERERPALTKREMEVVRLLASGLTVSEISQQLHRSKQTISTQKNTAMRKLGIERDADLYRFIFESGQGALPKPLTGEAVRSSDDTGSMVG
jgi:two-component system, NarL family, captular synthesis response regulator RcsB